MGVLTSRIDQLLNAVKSGKVLLKSGEPTLEQLASDLDKVLRLPNGDIDLSTCSPLVRQLSRSFQIAHRTMIELDPANPQITPESSTPKEIEAAQREYFVLIDQFFEAATGTPASRFEEKMTFSNRVRAECESIGLLYQKAYEDYVPKLEHFYSKHGAKLLGAANVYSGMNAVVGGGSNFPKSAFNGYRKMALYADTVFIPDPVLPWLESKREMEGSGFVRLLQSCHDILRLRPLAEADLPYPAVLVFPSWEKWLEENDEATKEGIGELSLSFFGHYLNACFEDESEVYKYVVGDGATEFRRAVKRHGLLLPSGTVEPKDVDEGVRLYLENAQKWRSPEHYQALLKQPHESIAWLLIMERLGPQFHIRDNARTMSAQPLFWNRAHYHYFNLCATATSQRLEQEKVIDQKTVTLLAALNQPALAWLGNVDLPDLVRLREANANELFRKKLAEHLKGLSEADGTNINRVAAEVSRAIASLISEHSREADKLWHDYKKKLVLSGGIAVTGGVALSPWLAGLLGLIPGAVAGLRDFAHYRMDKNNMSQTVFGILSEAKNAAH